MRCSELYVDTGERCFLPAGHDGPHVLNPDAHRCHAVGCVAKVKPEMLMCAKDWRLVPRGIQQAVYRHYRDGQCDDKNPSEAWHVAADAAIGAVAKVQGKLLSLNQISALKLYEASLK